MARDILRRAEGGRVAFWCPACREEHPLRVEGDGPPKWGFNGDYERPTFTPSVLVTGLQSVNDEKGEWTGEYICGADGKPLPLVCHSFIADGQIQFLGDCTHALAGQTVPLPDFPPGAD